MLFSEIHLSKQIYKHTQQETVVLTKGKKYLIKSLLCAEVVNQPGFARDGFYTDLDQIGPHLVVCYEQVKQQNDVGLRVFLEYGYWLELAYE